MGKSSGWRAELQTEHDMRIDTDHAMTHREAENERLLSQTHDLMHEVQRKEAEIERLREKLAERDSGLTNWYQAAIERATRIEQLETEIERLRESNVLLSTALDQCAEGSKDLSERYERLRAALELVRGVVKTGIPADRTDALAAWRRLEAALPEL